MTKGSRYTKTCPQRSYFDGYDYAGNDRTNPNNVPDGDPSPGDGCVAHGMACAGLIAASQNTLGVAGLAPNCKIMPLKIFDDSGRAADNDGVASALAHARLRGASILSNSWAFNRCDTGTFAHKSIRFAIRYASNAMPVFFAAGNGLGCVKFPANMKEVIAVGATDNADIRWYYSPYYSDGDSMDLVAPSGDLNLFGDIWSLDISGSRGYNPIINCQGGGPEQTANQNYTTRFGGTSASCPQAAGVAALLKSYDLKSPWRNMTLNDYKEVLKKSSDDLGVVGWDPLYGYGRLNAMKALVAIARGDCNKDGRITLADVITIVNYVFKGGSITPHVGLGDTNCDSYVIVADVTYLTNYYFQNPPGSPPPGICYEYDY